MKIELVMGITFMGINDFMGSIRISCPYRVVKESGVVR